jgi:hypothetical protein
MRVDKEASSNDEINKLDAEIPAGTNKSTVFVTVNIANSFRM